MTKTEMRAALTEFCDAAREIINAWSQGDLAGAVNRLEAIANAVEAEIAGA